MTDAGSGSPPGLHARSHAQQRRLLLAGAALVLAYYATFAALGIYPLPSLLAGLGIPVLLAAAAWRLPRAAGPEARAWPPVLAGGLSSLALTTAALAGGTACVGFHVVWALPIVEAILLPGAPAALLLGTAISVAGGLLLVVRDGHAPAEVAQWLAIAAGGAAFAVHRAALTRREQAVLLDQEGRRESLLRQAEQRYQLLAEHTHDVIWTLDPATQRLTFVSPSVARLLGLTQSEALARPLDEILTPESLERARRALATVGTAAEEDPHSAVYAQRTRDGRIIRVEVTATLNRDAAGRPVEVVGASRDVTTRVEAEAELRRSEERFRALIERSTDVILVVARDGTVRFWSPGATEALGWKAEQVVGRRWGELGLTHPDDAAAASEAMRAVLAGERPAAHLRGRVRHADGSWRLMDGVGRELFDVPAVAGLVVNVRDVTEQDRLEERLRQAQKLESVGRLAGGVAHDFNNLLTVILSCSDAIRQSAEAGTAPDPDDVAELGAAGRRARELTRQLLAFARRQQVAPVPLDVNEVVRRSEGLLGRVLGEDVRLVTELVDGPATVVFDAGQLDQVILNLAVNARDAMPEGGTLTVATRRVRVTPEEVAAAPGLVSGSWVQLEVRDTGVGMAREVKDNLFEPFFTTKPAGHGTGLGLATVYGIVRQAGGHVHVESEPGRGATFRVCLPHREEAIAAAPPPAAPAPAERPGAGELVLVVEDEDMVRRVTVRALTGAGYRVVAAGSGGEALAAAEGGPDPPRIAVTDVVMPGMGGREVARALRDRWPGLPVLFVSGYTRDAIGPRDLVEPGTAYLAKPFTPASLVAQVRRLLEA